MTRGPRIKNIPKRTRAKMLALCHIAGYNTWKQAVNHLLGVRDMVIKQP